MLEPLGFWVHAYPLQETTDWQFVFENLDYLAGGIVITLILTFASILLGFIIGFPAGAIEVYGGKYLKAPVKKAGVIIRGTPIVVILVFVFFVIGVDDPFVAGIIGLGGRSAAYQSQIFRGSLQSVSKGQMEAARSIGLSRLEAIIHVIVPQAIRRSVPGFQNEFTIVLKDTSIAIAIGLSELLTRSQDLFVQKTTAVTEIILFASVVYFFFTFTTNRLLDYVNERVSIPTGRSS